MQVGPCSHLHCSCIKPSAWHTVGIPCILAELNYAGARDRGCGWKERPLGGVDKAQLRLPLMSCSLSKWYKEYFHQHTASSTKTGNHQTPLLLPCQGGKQCCNA